MLPCLLSAMSVMPLVIKPLTVPSASKAVKDEATVERVEVKVVEAEVMLVLRAVKDLVEKVVVVVVAVIKAVKEIIIILTLPHVFVIFVRTQDILHITVRMHKSLQAFWRLASGCKIMVVITKNKDVCKIKRKITATESTP